MSTRSFICKEQPDGSFYGICCQNDGYLTYNGAMLIDHYSEGDKVDELLALGDISILREKLMPDPACLHSVDYNKDQHDVTVAYARDCGEKIQKAEAITLEKAKESWSSYMYIFSKDGRWKYYDLNTDMPDLRDVESDLNAKFEQMGILRPAEKYGFFPRQAIDRIREEQAHIQKAK